MRRRVAYGKAWSDDGPIGEALPKLRLWSIRKPLGFNKSIYKSKVLIFKSHHSMINSLVTFQVNFEMEVNHAL